jgi:alkanesulfonate monooxygenase SsuD/methylene tetrahydromethanopterin reductase-like flavin-dependent oxidoreductase (luciferase family)
MTIKYGLMAPQGWRMDLAEIVGPIEQYEAMTRVAKAADRLPAFDSLWLYDHLQTWPVISRQPTFEAWTTTAAFARDTTRINIGQFVTCASYRHPALLAKMASPVDVMSHGRLYFGLGAGWYEHEYHAYGYPFMETRDRMRAFRAEIAQHAGYYDEAHFDRDVRVFTGHSPTECLRLLRRAHAEHPGYGLPPKFLPTG